MKNMRQLLASKAGRGFLCLMIAVVAVALLCVRWPGVSAAIQQAAKRVTKTVTKSGKPAQGTRKSRPAQFLSQSQTNPDGTIQGGLIVTDEGITQTTDEIMENQLNARTEASRIRMKPERDVPGRENRPQNPKAPATATWPERANQNAPVALAAPQTTALSFDGATLTDTGAFPPDTMGAVGPTQFVTFVNGRLRSFTKAGVADGVLNADPDVFFASVMTPVTPPVVLNFTSDPNVRYDRFSARWFLTIIDVPCTNATCTTTASNRLMIAVSDAASNGTISGSTVWTFFQFVGDSTNTNFLDYPSLGIDVNALYIGGNMFGNISGTFVGTNGYVVLKSTVLSGGPATATLFANLVSGGAGAGPFAPRGVDNFDATATEGYFVGVDNLTFSTMMFRRVSSPGSTTPTISANISVTVPTTTSPNSVEHAGNTGGTNGRLDALDDRLYAAMIRNGRLWTAHNFRVTSAGVASTATESRNASRWYEFQNLTTTPTVRQSGTVFDNAATRAAARQYWIPSVTVSGQGHAVLGATMAGVVGATPVYVGRLSGDTLGTMQGPPGTAAVTIGTTTANYNPPANPGPPRRWGDYSFTSVDPLDDMTIWTIQEYNQASNSYAVRAARLAAPAPATPTCSGSPINFTGPTGNVVINATSSGGTGFYDPGANLPAPALPFNHLTATISNGTVNSVTFNSPTQVTLNITANANGLQNVTLTNPDGQSVTATGCINVSGITSPADLAISKTDGVATATPGGSTTYTIVASNSSANPATGATVADTFPATLACTWTCVGAGGGTCTASGSGNINDTVNLPAGASATYTATCAISASATGTLSNTATVTLAGDPNAANNSATDTDTLTPSANLGITKTDGVTTATPGGSVTYTIMASNAGPSNAPGSSVADTFPAALTCTWTCVGAGGGTCTASGSGNIGDTVNLPSGGSVTYTASCSVSAAATGSLSNTATVTAPGGVTDPTPGNNSATDTDTLAASANLGITKTDGVTTVTAGGSTTYTITASNAGPSNTTATVADTFPATLTCTWTCVGAGGGTCTASGSGNINDPVTLPSGGSVTYTAACSISAAATGSLTNTATVTGAATDPAPGNNSATDTDTIGASADLSITKTDGVTSVTAGGSTTYTITASNNGPSNVSGATVADTFPAPLTCTWTCVGAGGGTCTASGSGNINQSANLPSGGSVTYTASCSISAAATGTLSNTATVATGGGVTDPTPGNNSATDTDTLGASADLAITKTDGVTTATPGGSVTYTITASNSGPSNATGATVADTFPAPLTCTWTCVGAGGGTCTASGSGNINQSVNLPTGGSVTYTASCSVAANATGTLSNTATVAAPGGVTDPTPGNNSATDTDTLSPSANLGITKTDGVTTATAGGSVTYTITASNAGPSNAPGSTVADTFPATLTCTWTCVGAGGGTCTAAGSGNINDTVNLPSGGSVTYTASCNVSAAATGTLSNTATVAAPGGVTDPTPGNNSATDTDTIAASADLAITKTDGVTSVTAGGSTTYTITASNAGPSNATGATVADTFPAVLSCTWTCVGAGGGTCTASGSGNINNTVNLPSGGSVTYTASCSLSAAATGTLSNTATVAAPGGVTDPTPGNNSATDTDTIAAQANLGITKTDGVTSVTAGGSTTYTITASNAGPSNASGATVADTFPAVLTCTWTCVGAGGGACTASGSGNINDTVNLPSGGSVTYTASCSISGAASGTLSNTATVTAPGGVTDPTPGNNSATDTDTVTAPQADLAITKTDGVTTVTAGGSTTYTITASNAGPNSATGATVTDTFPAALSCTWTCMGAGGGACTASGSGNINNTVNLPSGGSVTYTASCAVSAGASGTISNTATVAPPGGVTDPNPGNNSATDTDTVACPAITVNPANPALPGGTAGTAYSQTFTPTGAFGNSASWSISAGALPAGLSLNPSTGELSGTPTQTGTFNFTVKATDSQNCMGTRPYSLVIGCPTVAVNPASLPSGQYGVAYSQTLTGGGGIAPYTFALQAGSSLPGGLTLNGATGAITGTPTATGATTFTIIATDANGCMGNRTYTVGIQCPTINIAPAALPIAQTGVPYSQTLAGSGGVGPYTFALHAGSSLPAGLTLTGAVISGTPTGSGPTTFTIDVTDTGLSAGPTPCGGNRTYTLTVGCPTITLSPASLPGGVQGTAYSQNVVAAPAGPAYSYAVSSGVLPTGLSLNAATGALTGTPSAAGNFSFTITATTGPCAGTQAYQILITASCTTPTINPPTLPAAALGTPYSQTLTVSSGTATFAVTSGTLPAGLTLASGGALTGTPTASGSFIFTVTATVAGGCTGSRLYVLSVSCGTITLTTVSPLTAGTQGAPYSQVISVSPAGAYTFSVFLGSLPPGLNLNTATGVISGTPGTTGTYNFTIKAQVGSCAGTKAYALTINASQAARAQLADYDGDRKADMAVWSQSGAWRIFNSATQQTVTQNWGTAGDVALLGDYDGDGKTDLAVFRPSNGTWYVKRSSNGSFLVKAWGEGTDIPVPGDYDSDGKTDIAVWRPAEGIWYVLRSSDQQYQATAWGSAAAPYLDVPVPGDYDGDGRTDLAVFRRGTGTWLARLSKTGTVLSRQWGLDTDVPTPGDYDGDGQTDIAVWRGSSGTWYIWESSAASPRAQDWGAAYAPYQDRAAAGDYDGDGQTDIAVRRASNQTWYILCSQDGSVLSQSNGLASDVLIGNKVR